MAYPTVLLMFVCAIGPGGKIPAAKFRVLLLRLTDDGLNEQEVQSLMRAFDADRALPVSGKRLWAVMGWLWTSL